LRNRLVKMKNKTELHCQSPLGISFCTKCISSSMVLLNVIRGFMIGQAPGKFTGCKEDFTRLVWPSRGKVFVIEKFTSKDVCPPVKTSYPPTENGNEAPVLYSVIACGSWHIDSTKRTNNIHLSSMWFYILDKNIIYILLWLSETIITVFFLDWNKIFDKKNKYVFKVKCVLSASAFSWIIL